MCRAEIRRSKDQLEINLASTIKDNNKCFCKYVSSKRKTRESLHLLLDAGRDMATSDEEKAEVLNAFFASVFNNKICIEGTQPPQPEDRDWENDHPTIQEIVSDLLHHVDTHKSMGPDGIHPRVLKELAGCSPSRFPSFTSSPG